MARKRTVAMANKDQANRRLVVVVAFDVVGFSALVEADEDTVLAAWRALRREIDPLISQGRGLRRLSADDHIDQTLSTERRQTSMLMDVHSALPRIS